MVKRRITKSYFNYFYKTKQNLLKKIACDLHKKYNMIGVDLEDLLAIARNELLYSMIHFDSILGAFNTLLWHRVSGSIHHFIDSNTKRTERYKSEARKEFINAEYNEPVGSGLIIEEMLESLNKEEADVLRLRYLSSMTLREITESTGFSTYKILDLQREGCEKLRNRFER